MHPQPKERHKKASRRKRGKDESQWRNVLKQKTSPSRQLAGFKTIWR